MNRKIYLPRAKSIQAMRFRGDNGEELINEFNCIKRITCRFDHGLSSIDVITNNGHTFFALPGDWITLDIAGNFRVISDSEFNLLYREDK